MNVDDSTQRKALITTSAVQGKVNQPAKADAEDLVQPIIKPVAMTSVNPPTKINIDVKAVEPDEDAWSPAAKRTLPQESLSQFAKSHSDSRLQGERRSQRSGSDKRRSKDGPAKEN